MAAIPTNPTTAERVGWMSECLKPACFLGFFVCIRQIRHIRHLDMRSRERRIFFR